jgi:hypothetical protein
MKYFMILFLFVSSCGDDTCGKISDRVYKTIDSYCAVEFPCCLCYCNNQGKGFMGGYGMGCMCLEEKKYAERDGICSLDRLNVTMQEDEFSHCIGGDRSTIIECSYDMIHKISSENPECGI